MNIKIGGIQYKVNFIEDLRDEEGKRVNGTLKTDQCSIDVATDVASQKTNIVILHEIVHALNSYFDVECDEHIVTKMSHGLHALIVDNQEFIQDIIKDDKKNRKSA